jgi:hypothetical protein
MRQHRGNLQSSILGIAATRNAILAAFVAFRSSIVVIYAPLSTRLIKLQTKLQILKHNRAVHLFYVVNQDNK